MSRRYTLHGPEGSTSPDYAAELNEQQFAAVTSPPGHALVIAGAGSGKTRTLTFRVAWLLEQGVPARNILLLTFTNKAAREMLERVGALVAQGAEGLWGGTFHSVGNRILRRHAERIGFRQGFSIMDREDSEDLIESVVAREGMRTPDRKFPKGEVLSDIFSYSLNTGFPIRKVLLEKYRYFIPQAEQIERVQVAYEARKKEANAMDFDDLLSKTLELLQTCEDVAAQYQEQFRHILVDEYQDTNRLQAEIVELFSKRHGNVMVVGDDAQSIYSWRGADFENILRFPQRHPDAQVFKIETNYRSVPAVLEVANSAILANERQFPKALSAVRPLIPEARAGPAFHEQPAGRIHRAARTGVARGGRGFTGDRGPLPLAFSLDGSATRIHATRHSLCHHERAPFFRAGAREGCRVIPEIFDQPEGRGCIQARRALASRHRRKIRRVAMVRIQRDSRWRKRVRSSRRGQGSHKGVESLAATRTHLFPTSLRWRPQP